MNRRNIIAEIIYKCLIKTSLSQNYFILKYWNTIWNLIIRRLKGAVKIKVHGKKILVNIGYTYPLYIKRYPKLNSPLIELVYQVSKSSNSDLIVFDIGAAIGDTALLINEICGNKIEKLICIDGDDEFSHYLNQNISGLIYAQAYFTILSSNGNDVNSLIRTHSGTASSQGENKSSSKTLDSIVLHFKLKKVDIIKIDVDGFDGEVLKGSRSILADFKPSVIFEWHPKLILQTGNNYNDAFKVLIECNYKTFLWYNKYGYFSFVTDVNSSLDLIAKFSENSVNDWHYDIIALHEDSKLNEQKLIDLEYSHLGIR